MALSRDSALFYLDASRNLSNLAPTAPGTARHPVFSRATSSTDFSAAGFVTTKLPGMPRYAMFTDALYGRQRPGVRVDEAATHVAPKGEGVAVDYTTRSAGIVDGNFRLGGIAGGVYLPGGTGIDQFAYQTKTVSATTRYTASALIEMDDGGVPVPANAAGADFAFVVGGVAVTDYAVRKIAGALYRVSGFIATGATPANNHGVLKYAAGSAKGFRMSGFDLTPNSILAAYWKTTGAGDVVVGAEQLHWPLALPPVAVCAYVRMGVMNPPSLWGTPATRRILSLGGSTDAAVPRMLLYSSTNTLIGLFQNSASASVTRQPLSGVSSFVVGDMAEVMVLVNTSGAVSIAYSRNGATVVGSGGYSAAPAGGLGSSTWNRVSLGQVGGQLHFGGAYSDVRVVKAADLTSSTDAGIMDEMRDFVLSPTGEKL
jgi:hypothetical protein